MSKIKEFEAGLDIIVENYIVQIVFIYIGHSQILRDEEDDSHSVNIVHPKYT